MTSTYREIRVREIRIIGEMRARYYWITETMGITSSYRVETVMFVRRPKRISIRLHNYYQTAPSRTFSKFVGGPLRIVYNTMWHRSLKNNIVGRRCLARVSSYADDDDDDKFFIDRKRTRPTSLSPRANRCRRLRQTFYTCRGRVPLRRFTTRRPTELLNSHDYHTI